MGYSENESSIRVDFFKESGKWYTVEAVQWTGEWKADKGLIHNEFAKSLRDHFSDCPNRFGNMDAVCFAPYYEFKTPVMIRNGGWNRHASK